MRLNVTGERWNTEDVHWKLRGESGRFSKVADGPVAYVTVEAENVVLGYLWFRDADNAAAFISRTSAGDAGRNASVAWAQELLEAKSRALSPSRAIAELTANAGGLTIGWVRAEPAKEAPSLAALKDLTNQ